MKKLLFLLCLAAAVTSGFAEVSVKSVEAHQRYPWNGLVDIAVTVQGSSEDVALADWSFAATNCLTQAVVPILSITRNGEDSGSDTTWTRRFIWNATNDVGAVKIDDLALTVEAKVLGGVQLWENGPYWAECNVGASKPEEYGYYFSHLKTPWACLHGDFR